MKLAQSTFSLCFTRNKIEVQIGCVGFIILSCCDNFISLSMIVEIDCKKFYAQITSGEFVYFRLSLLLVLHLFNINIYLFLSVLREGHRVLLTEQNFILSLKLNIKRNHWSIVTTTHKKNDS